MSQCTSRPSAKPAARRIPPPCSALRPTEGFIAKYENSQLLQKPTSHPLTHCTSHPQESHPTNASMAENAPSANTIIDDPKRAKVCTQETRRSHPSSDQPMQSMQLLLEALFKHKPALTPWLTLIRGTAPLDNGESQRFLPNYVVLTCSSDLQRARDQDQPQETWFGNRPDLAFGVIQEEGEARLNVLDTGYVGLMFAGA